MLQTYTQNICLKSFSTKDIYIKYAFIRDIGIIKYLKIYLQFFQILKIRGIKLKIKIKVDKQLLYLL